MSGASTTSPKRHWRLGWIPLAEILDGLHSDDAATRIAAAKQLLHARRHRDAEERFAVEIATLDDPVPDVRFHALSAMAIIKEDRTRLVSLLLGGPQVDASRKAAVLARIAEMLGPDSPSQGVFRTAVQALFLSNGKGVFDIALREDHSSATALPILEVAATLSLAPHLFTPWGHDPATATKELPLPAFHWPDRCCECGLLHPQASKTLPFSFSWEWVKEFQSFGRPP